MADASEGKIIGKKPEPKPEPVPEKKPRQIPKFTAYTEALVWLQRQEDWMETIAQRTKNDPILKDDLSLRTWLIVRNLQEVIPVLQNMKELYGTRISFNALMNKALEPIPEQKMSIVDIQKNAAWKALIEGVFQQHESANYDGFMESIGLIFSDEALSA